MGEFFRFVVAFIRGWRRKLGVVTLLMACLLMSGWLKSLYPRLPSPIPSQFVFDEKHWKVRYFFDRIDNTVDRLSLKDSCVILDRIQADAPIVVNNVIGVWFNATDANFPDLKVQSKAWKSYRQWCGFAVGSFHLKDGRFDLRIERFALPFWSIVIPLTLISAFLLLSKPRKSNQKKITEPVPENVA